MIFPASSRLLNIGCGTRYHADWVNIDIAPSHPDVLPCDVSRGLPFADRQFDAVYSSHVIEHVRHADVVPFLQECLRVLKPAGIVRIATPDLEVLAESYLATLRACASGAPAHADLEWLTIELLDQTVRERSGGEMLEYLRRPDLPNEPFVLDRIGEEGRALLRMIRTSGVAHGAAHWTAPQARFPAAAVRRMLRKVLERIVARYYGADAFRAMAIGRFRLSGEVHQWLYDRVSLACVLRRAGFVEPELRTADVSGIPRWRDFHLDVTAEGTVVKPDSLFMEARKVLS